VNEVIGEISSLLRSEAGRHAISIHTELGPELPHVMADRVQLQQVFMNLMVNGIDAINEAGIAGDGANIPGDLTIKSQTNAVDELLISISDTGIGLPPERRSPRVPVWVCPLAGRSLSRTEAAYGPPETLIGEQLLTSPYPSNLPRRRWYKH
jgi:nitrogen fixation/metabolism regulation signal transduction histidine kinase